MVRFSTLAVWAVCCSGSGSSTASAVTAFTPNPSSIPISNGRRVHHPSIPSSQLSMVNTNSVNDSDPFQRARSSTYRPLFDGNDNSRPVPFNQRQQQQQQQQQQRRPAPPPPQRPMQERTNDTNDRLPFPNPFGNLGQAGGGDEGDVLTIKRPVTIRLSDLGKDDDAPVNTRPTRERRPIDPNTSRERRPIDPATVRNRAPTTQTDQPKRLRLSDLGKAEDVFDVLTDQIAPRSNRRSAAQQKSKSDKKVWGGLYNRSPKTNQGNKGKPTSNKGRELLTDSSGPERGSRMGYDERAGYGGGPGGQGNGFAQRGGDLFSRVKDGGTIMMLKTDIGFLEREIKARKERFGVDVYDLINQLEYEYESFLAEANDERRSRFSNAADRQDAIDAALDRMEKDKEFRIRRLYDQARRDVDAFLNKMDLKEEEIRSLEAAGMVDDEEEDFNGGWDGRDGGNRGDPRGDYRGAGPPRGGDPRRGGGRMDNMEEERDPRRRRGPPGPGPGPGPEERSYRGGGRINVPKDMGRQQPPPPSSPMDRDQERPKRVRLSDIGKDQGGGGRYEEPMQYGSSRNEAASDGMGSPFSQQQQQRQQPRQQPPPPGAGGPRSQNQRVRLSDVGKDQSANRRDGQERYGPNPNGPRDMRPPQQPGGRMDDMGRANRGPPPPPNARGRMDGPGRKMGGPDDAMFDDTRPRTFDPRRGGGRLSDEGKTGMPPPRGEDLFDEFERNGPGAFGGRDGPGPRDSRERFDDRFDRDGPGPQERFDPREPRGRFEGPEGPGPRGNPRGFDREERGGPDLRERFDRIEREGGRPGDQNFRRDASTPLRDRFDPMNSRATEFRRDDRPGPRPGPPPPGAKRDNTRPTDGIQPEWGRNDEVSNPYLRPDPEDSGKGRSGRGDRGKTEWDASSEYNPYGGRGAGPQERVRLNDLGQQDRRRDQSPTSRDSRDAGFNSGGRVSGNDWLDDMNQRQNQPPNRARSDDRYGDTGQRW